MINEKTAHVFEILKTSVQKVNPVVPLNIIFVLKYMESNYLSSGTLTVIAIRSWLLSIYMHLHINTLYSKYALHVLYITLLYIYYITLSLKFKIFTIWLVETACIFLIFLIAIVQLSMKCGTQESQTGCTKQLNLY